MKTLYLECNMGAAGDMLTAALWELLDETRREEFLNTMNGLGLPGVEVRTEKAAQCGIWGTHMQVKVHGEEEESLDVNQEHIHEHGHEHAHGHEHTHCGEVHPGHTHDHVQEPVHGQEHSHEHPHGQNKYQEDVRLIEDLKLPEQVKQHAKPD